MENWLFFYQNHGLTPLKKGQFFDFLNFLFLQARKSFLRSRISTKTFSCNISSKKKNVEKWPFLDQNHWLIPLAKCQFFDFLNFLFLQPRKAFFRSRISSNTFSWPTLSKKKNGKLAIIGPKPWVNTFGKMSIFRLFKLFLFMAQKGFVRSKIS